MSELHKAIGAVMAAVGYVKKGGRVSGGGMNYTFAGEADLLKALRPAMVEAGLSMCPVGCELFEHHEMVETNYGPKPSRTVRVIATYRLAHVGGEYMDLQTAGEGQDKGDKATAKAMTIALKYALRQAFLIETGDDPDRVRPEDDYDSRQQPSKPKQSAAHAEIRRMLAGIGAKTRADADALCRLATDHAVSAFDSLSDREAAAVLDGIKDASKDHSAAELLAIARKDYGAAR